MILFDGKVTDCQVHTRNGDGTEKIMICQVEYDAFCEGDEPFKASVQFKVPIRHDYDPRKYVGGVFEMIVHESK